MAMDLTGGGMYCIIPRALGDDMQVPAQAKLLYGKIVQLANARGYCYATNEALLGILTYQDPKTGAISCPSERTLQRMLAGLRDRGYIHMDTGPVPGSNGRTTTMRRIFVGQKLADPPEDLGVTNLSPPDKNVTPGVTKMSPPIISKNKNKKNTPLPPSWIWDAIDNYLFSTGRDGDAEFRAALEEFVEYRSAIKKPIKAKQTLSAILNKLAKVNQRDAELAMLRKAMEMGWTSIFPLKADEMPETAKPAGKRYAGTKIVDGVEVDVYE